MFELNTKFGQGFKITFKNGLTISVQFGEGFYCTPKKNAEIAIWDNQDNQHTFEYDRLESGWESPENLAKWIYLVSTAKNIKELPQKI